MGYRLCAFLDAEAPLEIFRRLLVGSEGTLAFTAEAVFDTVPLLPKTTTSWVHFESIDAACEPVPDLVAAGASAVEMMVAPALMVAANSIPGAPKHWLELPPTSAALLIEFRSDDEADLPAMEAKAAEVLAEPRDDPRPGVHPGPRDGRAQLAGPRGPPRADRAPAPARAPR